MANKEGGIRGFRWSLKGMTALVTGGAHGMGHAVVEDLAEFGTTVYTCSRNEAVLNKCLKEWWDHDFIVYGSICDFTSRPQREKLIKDVASKFNGNLNILVSSVLHYKMHFHTLFLLGCQDLTIDASKSDALRTLVLISAKKN